jgi:prolipoprotein diacylglyceryltransferase
LARVDNIPRHPVQLYEALCYLLAFILQFRYYQKYGAGQDGYLFGRFFIFIFGSRFFMEFFKEEQAAFQVGWALTLGQWLSIPAVLAGVYFIWRAKQKEAVS